MTAPDYSGFEEQLSPEQLTTLANLATMLEAADKEVEELELALGEAKKRVTQLREHDIPALMQQLGVKSITTSGGIGIKLREEVRASFFAKDKAKREPAFAWLRQHKHEGLIKNVVSASFPTDQEALAERFAEFAKTFDAPVTVQQSRDIHHQTLLAFLREQLREEVKIPLELFGAIVQTFAEVKRDK